MCGWQVKLCDPLVTHDHYLSALEVRHDEALHKSTFTLLYFTFMSPNKLLHRVYRRQSPVNMRGLGLYNELT